MQEIIAYQTMPDCHDYACITPSSTPLSSSAQRFRKTSSPPARLLRRPIAVHAVDLAHADLVAHAPPFVVSLPFLTSHGRLVVVRADVAQGVPSQSFECPGEPRIISRGGPRRNERLEGEIHDRLGLLRSSHQGQGGGGAKGLGTEGEVGKTRR